MSQLQVSADHIAAFHAYMQEISGQLTEIGTYVWNNVALTDAYGEGLLAPIGDAVRDVACRPFMDGLSEARTLLAHARSNLWEVGEAFDLVDGQIAEYYRDTAGFQDE